MELRKLPKIDPESTCIWLDLEGVLIEKNIAFYLFFQDPLLVFRCYVEGISRALSNKLRKQKKCFVKDFITEFKKAYEEELGSYRLYLLGKKIFEAQSNKHKKVLMDLLKVLKEDGYECFVITKARKEIAEGFMDNLPEELRIEKEKIFQTQQKAEIVEYLKLKTLKKIVGVGDTKEDEEALAVSDVACVISNLAYNLFPPKVEKGYKFENLAQLKSFFDAIYYQKIFERDLKIWKTIDK